MPLVAANPSHHIAWSCKRMHALAYERLQAISFGSNTNLSMRANRIAKKKKVNCPHKLDKLNSKGVTRHAPTLVEKIRAGKFYRVASSTSQNRDSCWLRTLPRSIDWGTPVSRALFTAVLQSKLMRR